MSKRNTVFVGATLLALAACSQNSEVPDGAAPVAVEQDSLANGNHAPPKAIQKSAEVTALRRVQQPALVPKLEKTVRNAEGEPVKIQVPVEDAPAVEVQEGGVCGVANAEGVLLSCVAGTQCVSSAAGAPATCVRLPHAPRTEG